MSAEPRPATGPAEPLSIEQVRKIASLARLALSPAQAEEFRSTLSAVLAYAERLGALDLSGVEPMASPLDATSRPQADDPEPPLSGELAMRLSPESFGGFIKVPKVLGEGGGA
ncbi:MAG: Asp-tRNA(Asn)/Glu-tRNA(Gln) amidotransferase subunit GatC [Phycisphaeraceae bacterium]|nr:Asp-tRNA(Asn)/Glu-tRNA(Gln) amidotransferase subunit GatC [Phycisphaeraceae bacterium]